MLKIKDEIFVDIKELEKVEFNENTRQMACSEEYKAIKWLKNKTTNYSDDSIVLHYNLILYNLIINLQHQLEKKQEVIDKAIDYIDKALLGEFPDGVMYWLKDDEVGKNLLSILEDKEVE